jgi:hypothetical protein
MLHDDRDLPGGPQLSHLDQQGLEDAQQEVRGEKPQTAAFIQDAGDVDRGSRMGDPLQEMEEQPQPLDGLIIRNSPARRFGSAVVAYPVADMVVMPGLHFSDEMETV